MQPNDGTSTALTAVSFSAAFGEVSKLQLVQKRVISNVELCITTAGGSVIKVMLEPNSALSLTAGHDASQTGVSITLSDREGLAPSLRLVGGVSDSDKKESEHD